MSHLIRPEHLLGKPDKITASTYRYGSLKGSLVVTLAGDKRGCWFDFQTGEGGNLLSLIGKTLGYHPKKDFLQTLAYAAKAVGVTPGMMAEHKTTKTATLEKAPSKRPVFSEYQQKRIALAQKLDRSFALC